MCGALETTGYQYEGYLDKLQLIAHPMPDLRILMRLTDSPVESDSRAPDDCSGLRHSS
jgi:hypothetical protein